MCFVENSRLISNETKQTTKQKKKKKRRRVEFVRGAIVKNGSTSTARDSGDSTRQQRWIDTTCTREAPSTAGGARGPTRSLRSALELMYRPSLFDGRRWHVEWNSFRKKYRHSHFLIPLFLARAPLDDSLRTHICSHRQQTWRVAATCPTSAVLRLSTGRRNVIGTSSQRFELLRCSSSTLGNPYFVY